MRLGADIEPKDDREDMIEDPFENYVECHYCGANVPDNNNCPACGVKLHCEKCGTLPKPGARFCHNCGSKLPIPEEEELYSNTVICPGCQKEVELGLNFCPNCGFNLEEIDSYKNNEIKRNGGGRI